MPDLTIHIPDSIPLSPDILALYRAFLQGMANRRVVGILQYGEKPRRQLQYLTKLRAELKAYTQTGNFEHLLNIANYAFLEGVAPQNPKLHFDPTAASVTRVEEV